MKRISILFLLLFVLNQSYGQDTIFFDAYGPDAYRLFDLNNKDTTDKYFTSTLLKQIILGNLGLHQNSFLILRIPIP